MSASETGSTVGAGDALFDRYTLPKVALAIILVASLVGAWVTTALSGGTGITLAIARWAYFVALGVLTGGLVWKHAFVRPADLGTGAADYCAAMYHRFDRIAALAILALLAGAPLVVGRYLAAFGRTPGTLAYGLLVLGLVTIVAANSRRRGDVTAQFRSTAGVAALALAVAVVVATAVAEVSLRGFDPAAAAVRVLHLLAVAVWLGGAVWNIFVAVPTGQERATVPVVQAAGEQLERFRWAVRGIIPTLLLTGLFQAVDGLGTTLATYLGSTVGLAVLAKLGFVGVLVVIFKLCPLWRACSPIEGVCDLEEIGGGQSRPEGAIDDGPTEASADD